MNSRQFTAAILTIATLAGSGASPGAGGVDWPEGVRVLYARSTDGVVGYLPSSPSVVDASGAPGRLTVQTLGLATRTATGFVALRAPDELVEALNREAKARFGHKARVEPVVPSSVHWWLYVGDLVVWERPAADLSSRPIPIRATWEFQPVDRE